MLRLRCRAVEGRIVKFTYDALGRTTKVTRGYLTANAIDEKTTVFSATTGQLTSVTDGEGNTTSYAYDGFGPSQMCSAHPAGQWSQDHDLGGRLDSTHASRTCTLRPSHYRNLKHPR